MEHEENLKGSFIIGKIRSVSFNLPQKLTSYGQNPLHFKSYKEAVKGLYQTFPPYIIEIIVTKKPTPMTQRKSKCHLG